MRITVNLDTCAVTTTPAPFRLKAASLAQVEVQFTRASSPVPLPAASVIEFGLKAKGQSDSELLIYSNAFSATSGTLYAANVNCATVPLQAALGIGDGDTSNDKTAVEFAGEVSWCVDGANAFRSQTFPVFVDAPVISSGAPALFMPPRYPVLDGNVLHFVRGDGTLATIPVGGQGITLPNPINANVAYLGNGTWGLPNLANYTGNIGNTEVHAGSIYATLFGNVGSETEMTANIYGNHFGCFSGSFATSTGIYIDENGLHSQQNGSGVWGIDNNGEATFINLTLFNDSILAGPLTTDTTGALTSFNAAGTPVWSIDSAGNFSGNVWSTQAPLNDFFAADMGCNNGGLIGHPNAPIGAIYAYYFFGDGSGLTNLPGFDIAGAAILANSANFALNEFFANQTGGDIGFSNQPYGTVYANSFVGDGSSMTAGYAYTSGGAALAQVAFNDFFTPTTNWTTMDLGQSGHSLGTVYANYFVGDGSGLSNVGGGADLSAWGTPDISNLGPVFGNTGGYSYFDNFGTANSAYLAQHADNTGNSFNEFFCYINNGDIGGSGSRVGEIYCQTLHSYDIHAEGSNVYAGRGYFSDYIVLPSLNYCPEAGGIYFNAGTGNFYGYNGYSQVQLGGVPDLSTYTGNIGTSDFNLPNIFASNACFGHLEVDGNVSISAGASLPSPASVGTICYSRHAGGHFYGMTDDGWKQLDN